MKLGNKTLNVNGADLDRRYFRGTSGKMTDYRRSPLMREIILRDPKMRQVLNTRQEQKEFFDAVIGPGRGDRWGLSANEARSALGKLAKESRYLSKKEVWTIARVMLPRWALKKGDRALIYPEKQAPRPRTETTMTGKSGKETPLPVSEKGRRVVDRSRGALRFLGTGTSRDTRHRATSISDELRSFGGRPLAFSRSISDIGSSVDRNTRVHDSGQTSTSSDLDARRFAHSFSEASPPHPPTPLGRLSISSSDIHARRAV